MKHTPGPWCIKEREPAATSYGAAHAEKTLSINGPKGRVARAFVGEVPFNEALANARLIAAAPAMLEKLRDIYKNMEHRPGDCYSDDYQGVCVCGKDSLGQFLKEVDNG